MGHVRGDGQGVYGRLRKRLDRYPVGAPDNETLYRILRLLFSEEEAEIGARMPMRFTDIGGVAKRTGRTPSELRPVLDRMAEKGLVMDFDRKGTTEYILSPTLLGFFEFAFMRVRDDIPQKELAGYMVAYAHDNADFAREVFAGKTQGGRTLVHESALDAGDATEILSHERAAELIRSAKTRAVSLCYCRHVMEHEGKPCGKPLEVCTTFNAAADFLVRRRLARPIGREEAFEIFARTRDAGLVHVADNVKRKPAFVCHCCGCCCMMLSAINNFKIFDAVVTSPFLASVDSAACSGCGLCAKRCPVRALRMEGAGKEARAVVDERICLGCGVCSPACAKGALRMERRRERVLVPETAWERVVLMAIERGKFHELLFDNYDRLDHAVLRAVTRILVGLPPVKKALLSRQVRSRFLGALAG